MAVSFGVRKGVWTEEEDSLLRKCVEEYGEAKWHQVPARAGLNRCRKSCRLRWLNYLRPNIKRGEFTEDEVDLMFKLHKLLGNRWSLIAGRLPGRTTNDVKNYWNSRIRKKIGNSCYKGVKPKAQIQKTEKVNVIKPRPRTFSGNSTWLKGKTTISDHFKPSTPFDDRQPETESETVWWEGLSRGNNQFHHGIDSSTHRSEGESIANLLAEKSYPGTTLEETFDQVGQGCETDDFPFDARSFGIFSMRIEEV